MVVPPSQQFFWQEINQPEDQIDLAKAALYLALEDYPNLDPESYLNALDTMAQDIDERLPSERYPLRVIKTINEYLYQDLGFTGNTEDYYDPRNSFLNQVIDRRTGIPITLSLVYLEIARRLDFPMIGIGMPGHFLIRPLVEDMQIFVDAFHGGEVMFEEDCQGRLNEIYGTAVVFQPEFLQSVSPKRFLARMLGNLKMIYITRQNLRKCLTVINQLLLVFPDAPTEYRDRGLIYYQLNQWDNAIPDLERYITDAPHAQDSPVIRQLLQQMGQDLS